MLTHAFAFIDDWRERRAKAGSMLIALDFDGTIAPIVPHPDEAQLIPRARPVLEALSKRKDTEIALISGRSLRDLRERIGIADVYYAGNHGLEISGPDLDDVVPAALELEPRVQSIWRAVEAEVGAIDGVFIENKHLSLSIHYRQIDDEAEQKRVQDGVRRVFDREPGGLRLTTGKRVLEIRPDIDWHKGKALLFILEDIQRAHGVEMMPLFVGDDKTDEDGFEAIAGRGAGVLVGAADAVTAATSYVRNPDETVDLLERLL
jgi:trehalose 6-phosphate phosphatase